jgi:hypothetical protein
MTSLAERLGTIRKMAKQGELTPAETHLRKLIGELSPEMILTVETDIRRAIADFVLPTQRENLTQTLERRLAVSPRSQDVTDNDSQELVRSVGGNELTAVRQALRGRLSDLRDWHIFQWATFYRDAVGEIFDTFTQMAKKAPHPPEWAEILREEFSDHAREIYSRGFNHQMGQQQANPEGAVLKQLNGLERFIALPIACYLASSGGTADFHEARALRAVCSAMLAGILQGYSETEFGSQMGWQILPRDSVSRRWAHCLPFLCQDHLRLVIDRLESGEFVSGILSNVVPLIEAIEQLLQDPNLFVLPAIGEYMRDRRSRRLDTMFAVPHSAEGRQQIDVHCYLNHVEIDRYQLEESARRGATLIVAPLRADLQEWVETHDLLRRVVINSMPTSGGSSAAISADAYGRLAEEVASRRQVDAGAVLTYNYARDFPLEKPSWKKFFFIQRPSVRNLLHSFERHTGVRLWCSVRRSGKTTAGFELGSTTGNAVVVSQTCDSTGERPDDDVFYRRFTDALDSGKRLSSTFFADSVAACLADPLRPDDKIVFILDEYETLFGQLRLAVEENAAQRYRVVQPLLNQMVSFSRENLLVLIGMQPDAHFVIMDQNQLSPCIEQDHFPLFAHSPEAMTSEFRNLLRRALTDRVELEPAFADIVHTETGGHPYLTVNLLVELFDWLISCRRPVAGLRLTDDDFRRFAAERLTFSAISQSNSYNVMRQFVRGALAERNRRQQPWLYAVTAMLQQLAQESPNSLAIPRTQAGDMVRRLGLENSGIDDPDYLLRTAVQANFFHFEGDAIRPQIPLLARIAHSITAPISA